VKNLIFVIEDKTKDEQKSAKFVIEGDSANEVVDDLLSKLFDLEINIEDDELNNITERLAIIIEKNLKEYDLIKATEKKQQIDLIRRH